MTSDSQDTNNSAPNPAPSAEPSVTPIDPNAARIAELEAQVKDKEQKYLYLYAEFENFKKRAIKDRSDTLKFGWEPVARELLQVVDNLERALSHVPQGTDKSFIDGLNMILSQFRETMQKQGVQKIDSVKKNFDPNFHEAVAQDETPDVPAGTITKEHASGYTLHGRLLRPARVSVSGGKAANGI